MASNRNVLKRYAPQARLDFIQAITNRAAQFGITKDGNTSGELQGDLYILNGKAFPRSLANQRNRLISRIARDGFAQTMEAVAYTWFNRFLAIRYMEVHDYFDHGCRVLSNPNSHAEPEILEKATSIDLAGLNQDEIVNLKLDGTKDEQIYRKLLTAQCNDLHRSMPFLFEKIDDETELLLPENLLQSDSIVRKLVNEIDEDEWQEVEIIGWLYQFYISEKKDQVMGKVVKSEDIPAATQLFTPNWIVKYMVQNSLGAQWLATYPDSGIRSNMEYYIAPAAQTPEVQAQIDTITPKQLDPEAITLIDPAVGSGHILVEAYDLFRSIYLERGYTKREAARAILTKNLIGIDIDDRAAQMAGFALLMKACADDRTVLRNAPKLNVLALQDSEGLDVDALAKALLPQERFEVVPSSDLLPETLAQPTLAAKQATSAEAKAIKALLNLFDGAKTFGSLITVPDSVMQSLPLLDTLLAKPLTGDLYLRQAQEDAQEALKPLVEQARLLGDRYDCVVANPPYMGRKGMNTDLKAFAERHYPHGKSDLFALFMERNLELAAEFGSVAMITMQSWMFLGSYKDLRLNLFTNNQILNMLHTGPGLFPDLGAFNALTTCFTISNYKLNDEFLTKFIKANDVLSIKDKMQCIENENLHYQKSVINFKKVPDYPLIYWFTDKALNNFESCNLIEDICPPRAGMATGDNSLFVRSWWEVASKKISFSSKNKEEALNSMKKWFPYNKGGNYRKWYGNNIYIVNWENDGNLIKNFCDKNGNVRSSIRNPDYYFKAGIEYSLFGFENFGVRMKEDGFIFDVSGSSMFPKADSDIVLAFLCSNVGFYYLKSLAPTVNFQVGDLARLPLPNLKDDEKADVSRFSLENIALCKADWDGNEFSWNFTSQPFINCRKDTLEASIREYEKEYNNGRNLLRKNEEYVNKILAYKYGLHEEVELCVNDRDLTIKSFELIGACSDFISYAVGCIMGRYSLAETGLIYAHSGNVGFDPSRYGAFPADGDGIVPLTEEQWFADDVAVRIEEFLGVAWPEAPVMETLTTLMDGLSMDKTGEPRAALRSYLSKQFYKDHLQTYKNRPIYWLFSSGKQKAFEALVYLHRYNEGTLARMRTVYVAPLMGKLQQRMADLEDDIGRSSSSADKTRMTREKDKLVKQVVELRAFDEELRHLADQRITLDLDDGVKVNYGRFGNLLASKDKVIPKNKGGDE